MTLAARGPIGADLTVFPGMLPAKEIKHLAQYRARRSLSLLNLYCFSTKLCEYARSGELMSIEVSWEVASIAHLSFITGACLNPSTKSPVAHRTVNSTTSSRINWHLSVQILNLVKRISAAALDPRNAMAL